MSANTFVPGPTPNTVRAVDGKILGAYGPRMMRVVGRLAASVVENNRPAEDAGGDHRRERRE